MVIKNKIDSIKLIKQLNLNRFPERLFINYQEQDVVDFLEKYPAQYYAIRDRSKSNGVFKLSVEKKDVLNEIKEYTIFSINVSSYNYVNNQIINGEIEICSNNNVYAQFSADPNAVGRPDDKNTVIINTNIYNTKELEKIPNFDYIYEYIIDNKLKDIIVEFALFNTEVGINNERIIVYELRTNY